MSSRCLCMKHFVLKHAVHEKYTAAKLIDLVAMTLRGGSAVGRWTCDLQVAGSIPGWWLSRNIRQLSLASLRGR